VYRPLDISPGCWVTAPTGCLDGKTDGKDALVAIFKTSDCYHAAWRYDPLDMKGQRRTRQKTSQLCQAHCLSVNATTFTWWKNQGCHCQDANARGRSDRGTAASGPTKCPAAKIDWKYDSNIDRKTVTAASCAAQAQKYNRICGTADIRTLFVPTQGAPSSLGEVAKGKATSQSSEGWSGRPSRAVDGNSDGNYGRNSCTHTNNRNSWWKVSLGASYQVESVVVWNRVDCCSERLKGYTVKVGDDVCGTLTNTPKQTVQCMKQGDSVTISGTGHHLTLCEVEVWGRVQGTSKSRELSAADCQKRCAATKGCSTFSWWSSGDCHLQPRGATPSNATNVTAGASSCEEENLQIAQSRSTTAEAGRIEDLPSGQHSMPDGSLMADSAMIVTPLVSSDLADLEVDRDSNGDQGSSADGDQSSDGDDTTPWRPDSTPPDPQPDVSDGVEGMPTGRNEEDLQIQEGLAASMYDGDHVQEAHTPTYSGTQMLGALFLSEQH